MVSITRKFGICEHHVTLLLASHSCTCVHCVPVPVVSSDFGFQQCIRFMKTRAPSNTSSQHCCHVNCEVVNDQITKCFSPPFSLHCIEYKAQTSSHLHAIENERTKMYLPGTFTFASTYTSTPGLTQSVRTPAIFQHTCGFHTCSHGGRRVREELSELGGLGRGRCARGLVLGPS